MATVIAILAAVILLYIRKKIKIRSWQHRILKDLDSLEKSLSPENSQTIAIQISALIRRLAIHKYSREECASLKGNAWLAWLSQKDAGKFDWRKLSQFLIEVPYSPQGFGPDLNTVKLTIKATKGWVK